MTSRWPQLEIAPFDVEGLKRAASLPIWAFHGADDGVVPLSESETVVDILREAGSDVRLTVYPGVGHDSWTQTYANPELYDWLFAQSRR